MSFYIIFQIKNILQLISLSILVNFNNQKYDLYCHIQNTDTDAPEISFQKNYKSQVRRPALTVIKM